MQKDELYKIIPSTGVKGYWSIEEKEKFIEAIFLFGKDWKKVCDHIKTRTIEQSRSHSQKYFCNLKKIFRNENISQLEENNIRKWIKQYVKDNIMPSIIKFHNNIENFDKKLQNICLIIRKSLKASKENNINKKDKIKCCCVSRKLCDCGDGCCKVSASEDGIYFDSENFVNISHENIIENKSLTMTSRCKNKRKEDEIFKFPEITTGSENIKNSKNILFSYPENLESLLEPEALFDEIKLPSQFNYPPSIREPDIKEEYNLDFNSPYPFDEVISCKFNLDVVDFNIDEYLNIIGNNFTF